MRLQNFLLFYGGTMKDLDKLPPLAAYQEYCRQGLLAYQYCPDDGSAVFYPRILSPVSGSPNLEWRISKGLGTVYATTTVHGKPGEEAPYNVAIIDMDEGYRMMSRVEDIPPQAVKIGMRVRARMHTDEKGQTYPVFSPAEGK
jgi:uncharacterized OB-fold protein